MGYCVDMKVSVMVPTDKTKACLQAINKLHDPSLVLKQGGGGSSSGERWYSWVRNPPGNSFPSLIAALQEWRYEVEETEEGLAITYFAGEKWGDDEILYDAIAPFVKGAIEIHGEDGALWRYDFVDGQAIRKDGRVVYD